MHHLAKAALSQNHDEVEVRELDPVLIAIAVILAHQGGGRRVCGLSWTHPRPLERGGQKQATITTEEYISIRLKKAAQIKPAVILCTSPQIFVEAPHYHPLHLVGQEH